MTETNKVEIIIQGKSYPLVVSKEEMKWVKKIENSINDRLSNIQKAHTNINFVDSLSLALIATEFDNYTKSIEVSKLQQSLEKIDTALGSL